MNNDLPLAGLARRARAMGLATPVLVILHTIRPLSAALVPLLLVGTPVARMLGVERQLGQMVCAVKDEHWWSAIENVLQ